MSDGPIANYVFNSGYPDAADKLLGYTAVGPGWTSILKVLDALMVSSVAHAVQHATVVKEEYRDKECKADASISILQIKEKFGGLRVYWQGSGLGDRIWNQVNGSVNMAEGMAYQMCERCGSMEEVENRPRVNTKFSRTLTLCGSCHEDRDNEEGKVPFEMGNGDKV